MENYKYCDTHRVKQSKTHSTMQIIINLNLLQRLAVKGFDHGYRQGAKSSAEFGTQTSFPC